MVRHMTAALAALLGAFLMDAALAADCPCTQPTLEDLIESERDIAVFTARVESVLTPDKGRPALVRLQVGELIRGEPPRVVEMSGVTREDNPCGVDFRPGELRTLGAYRRDGRWLTDLCHVPRH